MINAIYFLFGYVMQRALNNSISHHSFWWADGDSIMTNCTSPRFIVAISDVNVINDFILYIIHSKYISIHLIYYEFGLEIEYLLPIV